MRYAADFESQEVLHALDDVVQALDLEHSDIENKPPNSDNDDDYAIPL